MMRRTTLLLGLLLLGACSSSLGDRGVEDQPGPPQTGGQSDGLLPGRTIDVAGLPSAQASQTIAVEDGDRIELSPTLVRKTIGNKEFPMYGYNSQIPGPTIVAPQGATFTVDVTNNIDLPTTIHWHGIRLDNANDGVPGVTQEAIEPGESFRYTVHVPDEGIYWYHPHVREDIQQDLGLYGNLLVKPSKDDAYAPMNREEVIVLDDLMLDQGGNLIPYGNDDATHPLMGRFGNLMIVNGAIASNYNLKVDRGSVVRFYLTNVANTRTFRIRIDGGAMKLVGSDVGRYEKEEWVDSVTIAPAERSIVDVLFEDDGQFRITHESPVETYALGTVTVAPTDAIPSYSKEFNELRTNEDVIADIEDYREYFDSPIDKTLHLSIEMQGMAHGMMAMDHSIDGIEWEDSMPQMNTTSTKENTQWKLIDEETGDENMDINWKFRVGDVAKIRIVNDRDSDHPMHHPIHFHGQRFLVLAIDGVPNDNLVWKDTVLVPKDATVDLLFDMSNPGDWMFHCHTAEHLTNGMMGMLSVEE